MLRNALTLLPSRNLNRRRRVDSFELRSAGNMDADAEVDTERSTAFETKEDIEMVPGTVEFVDGTNLCDENTISYPNYCMLVWDDADNFFKSRELLIDLRTDLVEIQMSFSSHNPRATQTTL